MKNIIIVLSCFCFITSRAQNTGIGTSNPQQKLHVAGGMRIDTLAGAGNGVIRFNGNGDIIRFPETNIESDVLRGNGTWGPAVGAVPTGSIIGTYSYNDPALINAGFTLMGELPGVSRFSSFSSMFSAGTWVPTYTRGVVTKVSAPNSPGATFTVGTNGSLMYVLAVHDLYSYDPLTDTWALVSTNTFPIGTANGRKVVWTGTDLIIWGGYFFSATDNGVRYNPVTNTWAPIATLNQPSARSGFTMVWDGSRVIVWGGETLAGTVPGDGAMYDPVTNTWTTINAGGAPSARTAHTAVWNTATNQMIVWGGSSTTIGLPGQLLNTGALFNPATNTWTGATNTIGAPQERRFHTAIWTGAEMIIHGGENGVSISAGARYNPATNTWSNISTSGAPLIHAHSSVWTGSNMLVTGGIYNFGAGNNYSNLSYSYNPTTNAWTYSGVYHIEARAEHISFVAAGMVVLFSGLKPTFNPQTGTTGIDFANTGARYFLSPVSSSVTHIITGNTLYLYGKN